MGSKLIFDSWEEAGIELPPYASGQVYLLCPHCSHERRREHLHTKCLSIDTQRGLFHCFNCDFRGGIRGMSGSHYTPKKKYVLPQVPMPIDVSDPLPKEAIEWFANRCISEDTVRHHEVTVTRHWFSQIDRESACLAFPYYGPEGLTNIKYRVASKKLFTQEKDAEPIFYGLNSCTHDDNFCVIVEGEMDKLACYEAQILPVLSVPNGAPPEGSEPVMDYFASGLEIFDRVSRVILATDADGPGQGLSAELARRIGMDKCFQVQWPEDAKDANEVLIKYGVDILRELIADAKPFPMEGVFTVSDVSDQLWRLYQNGNPPGFSIGIPSLENKYTVHLGYVTIVGGIPSHGKTQVLNQIAVNMAEEYGWKFAMFSPESGKWESHVARLMMKRSRRPFFDGLTQRMSVDEYTDARDWCDEHFLSIRPEKPNLDEILSKAKVLIGREGVNGLILDPWNTIETSKPRDQLMHEYIGDCLLKIQNFARNHDVHIWVSVHPRKMQTFIGQDQPIPTPYDFADTAMWYNRGDVIVTIWRNIFQPGTPVKFLVQKARSEEFGIVGEYELRYDPVTTIYTGWEDGA